MRIVTHLPVLESRGGVELSLLETSRELAARGHRISLLYEQPGNLTDDFRSVCDSMRQGPSLRYSERPARDVARIALRAVTAARARPQVIFVNNFSELAWAAAVRALTRAPIVCHLHEFRPVRRGSLRALGGRASRFLVASEFMRRAWVNHGLDPRRVEVIHQGFSPAAYAVASEADRLRAREELELPAEAYVVLYLGRIIPEKGVDVLLDAWRALAPDPEHARLLLVGLPAAPDPYVEGLRASAPPGCDWRPMRRDVTSLLHACDVLALPSRWDEPFGRVVVEAMATGRPAVAAQVGGIPEILTGDFTGLMFPRGDASALAERLRTLESWRRTDPALGALCAAHAVENFSLDAAMSRLEGVFERVTGRAG